MSNVNFFGNNAVSQQTHGQPFYTQFRLSPEQVAAMEANRIAEQKRWEDFVQAQNLEARRIRKENALRAQEYKKTSDYLDIFIALYAGKWLDLFAAFGYVSHNVNETVNMHMTTSVTIKSIIDSEMARNKNPQQMEMLKQVNQICKDISSGSANQETVPEMTTYAMYLLSLYFVEKNNLLSVNSSPFLQYYMEEYCRKNRMKVDNHNYRVQIMAEKAAAQWRKYQKEQMNAYYKQMATSWNMDQLGDGKQTNTFHNQTVASWDMGQLGGMAAGF